MAKETHINEELNQLEYSCPKCNHKVIADIDLNPEVNRRIQNVIDSLQEKIKT